MPNSDVKLLRDGLAQVIAENKHHRTAEEEMSRHIIDLTLKIDQLALECDQANVKIDVLIGKPMKTSED